MKSHFDMGHWAWSSVALLAAAALVGCNGTAIVPDDFLPAPILNPGPVPSYGDLVERYNRKVWPLARLWAKTRVQLRWRDEKGNKKFEDGEGNLLFVRPNRVALAMGKLGHTVLWAGADEHRYWLFDLQDHGVAYVGHHRYVGEPCAQPLPLPVRPSLVPHLLSLMPIDPDPPPSVPGVEMVLGHYLIEPPGLNLRLLIDPRTMRPVRIDLTDDWGNSQVVCRLSEFKPLEVDGWSRSEWPQLARRAEFFVMGEDVRMTIKLITLSRDPEGRKIQDRIFDFDLLTRKFRRKLQQVIDLDAGCY